MNKLIIADTSCLIALSNINKLNLLKYLFNEIHITKEVLDEFGHSLPSWVTIRKVNNLEKQQSLESILDKGEASSMALALESPYSTLIIDESKGRKIAKSLNIEIIGTIGVLILAHKNGLISNLKETLNELSNQGFRISEKLLQAILLHLEKR